MGGAMAGIMLDSLGRLRDPWGSVVIRCDD